MNNHISPQNALPQDPLSQLRDIHLPEPISWWPPAPGWWILTAIILVTLFFTLRWLIKRRANNCYRREALQQLNQITTETNNLTQCHALLALLRRTAKTAYPTLALASELTAPMLSSLNHCCKQTVFDSSLQKNLGQLPYQANPVISDALLQQLQQATEQWIKKHQHNLWPQHNQGEVHADL